MAPQLPATFDELKARDPPYNSWGLWGEDNEYGQLNLLSPESVKRGRDAIKHGIPVNLNLPLMEDNINPGRGGVEHEILHHGNYADDKVTFNTQCSTQWDGFAHVPYQNYPEKGQYAYHGGLTTEQVKDPKCTKFGIHNLAQRPITGCAHLVDVEKHVRNKGGKLSQLDTSTPITLAQILACIADSNITINAGDVLIVRSGYTEAVRAMDAETKKTYDPMHGAIGVEPSEELMRWVWESGIAAVAGDAFAFESWPPKWEEGKRCIHEVFLAGWGIPLGELWDLRELSAKCEEFGQYTFMLTTMAMNLEGGIASPPNAQAIL